MSEPTTDVVTDVVTEITPAVAPSVPSPAKRPSARRVLVATLGVSCDRAVELLAGLDDAKRDELVDLYESDDPDKLLKIRTLVSKPVP